MEGGVGSTEGPKQPSSLTVDKSAVVTAIIADEALRAIDTHPESRRSRRRHDILLFPPKTLSWVLFFYMCPMSKEQARSCKIQTINDPNLSGLIHSRRRRRRRRLSFSIVW